MFEFLVVLIRQLLDPRQRSYLRFLEKKKQEELEQARLEAEQERERQRLLELQEDSSSSDSEEDLVWVELPTVVGTQVWQVKKSQASDLREVAAPAAPQVTPPTPRAASAPTSKLVFVQQRRSGWTQTEVDTVVVRSTWLVKSSDSSVEEDSAPAAQVQEPHVATPPAKEPEV